ncbi:MAG: signal peptidase I [Akkermansiaceae bacterium]|nr:signal peptidase I [Armatimonadota bacterium]
MQPTNQFTDQLANIDPVFIVGVVVALTLIRAALAKIKDPWARTISETCDTVNFVLILAFLLIRPFVAQAFFIPSESMESTLLVKDRLIVDKFSYRLHEPERNDVLVFEAPLVATDGQPNVDFIKRLIGKPGDTIQVKEAQVIVDGEPIDAPALGATDTHSYLRERMGLYPDTAVKLFPDYILVDGKRKVNKEEMAQVLGRSGAKIRIIPGQVYLNGKAVDEPFTNEDPDYNYPEDSDQPLKLGEDELFMMGDNRNHSKDSHIWGPLKRDSVVGHAVVLFWPPNRVGKIR